MGRATGAGAARGGGLRFEGRIAGFGSASGTRVVVGMWERSPFGHFADAMLEDAAGHRTLLAPTETVAAFVSETYSFDEVRVVPVSWRRIEGGLAVRAGEGGSALTARIAVGDVPPLGRLLRSVPRRLASDVRWLSMIDPIASRLVPGVHTAGSAGHGRLEYYGVTTMRRLAWAEASVDGQPLGAFAALDPPVRFGFGSAPPEPHLVDLTTVIRLPER
ncbi:hypothetical protein NVV95_13305 [Herbiconiux sp. CPCC 205716]|uniref:Uncharacterized protein n=1 Tax=Herbiconiux gentiana TaxID=2970912 RepID=A0ABT2GH16_9MICO|nr:hypothetical protein [Herbiconiux gentiana]MCS5715522.1 hypothetical protein [Herbiconiux gentiana]